MDKFGRGGSLAAMVATLAITCAVAYADSDAPPPRSARLGIAIAYLDESWRETNSYRSSGVMVVGVDPRGRAAKSGIVAGDVLVSVAGRTMREPSDLGYAERTLLSGSSVAVVLARDGGRSIKIFEIAPLGMTPPAPAEETAAPSTPLVLVEPKFAAAPPPETEESPGATAEAGPESAAAATPATEDTTAAAPDEDAEAAEDTTASSSTSAVAPAAAAAAVALGAAAVTKDGASDAAATPTAEATKLDAAADSAATPAAAGASASETAPAASSTTTATDVAPSATGAAGAGGSTGGAATGAAAAAGLAALSVVTPGGEHEVAETPDTAGADSDGATSEGDKPATSDLGLRGQPLTPDFATALGASGTEGVLVLGVTAAGPADRSGVRAGDIIVKVGDQPVADMDEVLKAAAASPSPVKVQTLRLGKPVVALVALDGPPPTPSEPPSQEQLLLELRDEVRALRREVQGLRKKTGK